MKLGSLFDGSGGFPLAGALNGIEPVWASEVEPYPIAVTTSRFPRMKHLGDVSKVNGAEIEPVDIITFGSPCQDMSVAGKRAGIKHDDHGDEETTRSGLFYEAIRIIKEMRYGTEGRFPTFIIWENVPGAFSSNRGEDFRTVLEEFVKIAEPTAVVPDVPKSGWAYADCWRGDGWSLAYRVFDAQYLRTAQRRKRIYLVLCLGDEAGAGKILFERDRLRGNYPQSGKARERTAAPSEGSLDADDREGAVIKAGGFKGLNSAKARIDGFAEEAAPTLAANKHDACVVIGFDGYNATDTGKKSATLGVNCGMSTGRNGVIIGVDIYNQSLTGDKSKTLNSAATDSDHIPCTVYSVENHPADSRVDIDESGTVQTLTSRMGTGGGNVPMVMEPVLIHDQATRFAGKHGDKSDGKGNGLGVGNPGDPMNTLTGGDRHAVVYALDRASFNQGENAQYDFEITDSGVNSTIVAKGPSAVCYGIGNGQANQSFSEEVIGALNCMHDQQAVAVPAKPYYIVRRITQTECARLQGFPDRWGDIDHKETMTDEEFAFWLEVKQTYDRINGRQTKDYTDKQILTWYNKLHNDGAEYKMWGNGIALPCALYVMEGIVEVVT